MSSTRSCGPLGTILGSFTVITWLRGKGKGRPRPPKVKNWGVCTLQYICAHAHYAYISIYHLSSLSMSMIYPSILKIVLIHPIPTQHHRVHSSFLPFRICNSFLWEWETFIYLFIWSIPYAYLHPSPLMNAFLSVQALIPSHKDALVIVLRLWHTHGATPYVDAPTLMGSDPHGRLPSCMETFTLLGCQHTTPNPLSHTMDVHFALPHLIL